MVDTAAKRNWLIDNADSIIVAGWILNHVDPIESNAAKLTERRQTYRESNLWAS